MNKLKVGILGASGAAGQEFIESLQTHPWFEIAALYGKSSAGKLFGDCEIIINNVEDRIKDMKIRPFAEDILSVPIKSIDIYCSALGGDNKKEIEGLYASQKPVYSTTSAFRYEEDVPIIIPEVNESHISMITEQKIKREWKGYVMPGPNCTTVGPVIALKAIGISPENISSIDLSSYQAVSGAGREAVLEYMKQKRAAEYSLDIDEYESGKKKWFEGNVISKIDGEVEKVQKEIKKIMGEFKIGSGSGYQYIIENAGFNVNAKCKRVPVEYGHTVSMFVRTKSKVKLEDIVGNIQAFNQKCIDRYRIDLGLPSAPEKFVEIAGEYGPQPFWDADRHNGMCTFIGQIQELQGENGISFDVLSHNLKKGAAKGSVMVMELMHKLNLNEDELK